MAVVNYLTIDEESVSEYKGNNDFDYIPDIQGSIVNIVNTSQQITDTYRYWPYGEVRSHIGTNPTPFQFGGALGYHTDTSGHIYVGARVYDPVNTNWITVDPTWPRNIAYAYTMSNPVTYVDPTGLQLAPSPPTIPSPPSWFPTSPTPTSPPVVAPITPVQGGIIACGVLAVYELCTYSPGRPTGPFTYIGDCIGKKLFPGVNSLPAPIHRIPHKSKRTSCTCFISETGTVPPCRGSVDLGVTVTIPPGDFTNGRAQCQSLKGQFNPIPGCKAGHVNCK